ncbi:MAG: hypothetical protein JOZ81_16870 [Chloroflexi bacterium]|nr:hypothetical protein [Chloroflexota bacterium]MBV9545917.1 hypothetical protein [Chloroflexota bacterium]
MRGQLADFFPELANADAKEEKRGRYHAHLQPAELGLDRFDPVEVNHGRVELSLEWGVGLARRTPQPSGNLPRSFSGILL